MTEEEVEGESSTTSLDENNTLKKKKKKGTRENLTWETS